MTPLHYAIVEGHTEVAALLLAAGASVDPLNSAGWTPLHYACMFGHTETAVLLVAAGADAHRPDDVDITSLFYAQHYSPATHVALLDMLPSRATALGLLEDVIDATGLNADLADVVLYHRCVFDSRHCGLAEEYRAARRQARREREAREEREAKEAEGESVAQRVKRQRRE